MKYKLGRTAREEFCGATVKSNPESEKENANAIANRCKSKCKIPPIVNIVQYTLIYILKRKRPEEGFL